jgi:hypothetical protein
VDVAAQPRPYVPALDRAPASVVPGQYAGRPSGDEIVLFVIGMRLNRIRRVWSWWPTFTAMPRMLKELEARPDSGFLGSRTYWSGRVVVTMQYWRSVEDLGRYANDPALTHAPMWKAFNGRVAGSGDVGIFHETYAVPADAIESLYGNMPVFGLAAAGEHVPRSRRRRSRAGARMEQQDPEFVAPEVQASRDG